MPRPKHPRTIHAPPAVEGFRPRGGNGRKEEVTLSLEEFEAIRLVDFEGFDQIRASALMEISRQTFGRVLRSGRFTLSKALVKGLHLTVEGGCYEIRENPRGPNTAGGRQHRHRGTMAASMETQNRSSGGAIMVENNATDEKDSKGTPPPGSGTGQGRGLGQGQGQGRGRGLGGGKGDGSCRKKDGGMGRGTGGGKGDGSCRNR